ncbi:MAG: lipopolysaccharide biosynthesis protein [Sedimentisphaerales bacterium]|nr:lipopolysaccharide biosynthesis protein [Sedimentisphaerales bacterium]
MILARLLAPGHFGLMALVLAASQLFEALTEVGIRQAVVQNKNSENHTFQNAAWWFSAVRGLFLYGLGWLAAPWLAQFYKEPALTPLLQVAFLVLVFNGMTSPGLFILEKKLRFGKVVLATQGAGLVGTIISLVLAMYYPNVWSLVVGFVAEAFLRCIASFLIFPYRPDFCFERKSAGDLFRYSRGMVGLPILTYLFVQADIFVLGRLTSKEMLGFYSMALALATMPQMLFTRIAGPMILPVFSEMQDQTERLRENLLRMSNVVYLFGLPMAVCLGIFAQPVLTLVYGESYGQVSTAFVLLNFYVLLYMASIFIATAYMAVGRPELHRSFTLFRVVLIGMSIYPAVRWAGVDGAAAVRVLCMVLAGILQLFSLKRLLLLPVRQYVQTANRGFVLALVLAGPAAAWRYWAGPPWLEVVGAMVLCGLAWLIGAWSLRGAVKQKLADSKTRNMPVAT